MPGSTRFATADLATDDLERPVDVRAAAPAPRSPSRRWTPVGPGRATPTLQHRSGPLIAETLGYPIQPAKVRPPTLREATLERARLLDWLHGKIHGRVVMVIADAGYGKSTLLADFSRRTRLRTLWYRLDEDDRDWTTFLAHLIAAGREHDPSFAPETLALLARVATDGITREAALDTFLQELEPLSVGGAVLILDDFHLVDDAPDCRVIVRELIARAPERFCVVFSSRQRPPIALGRLQLIGDVARLGTDELRFDLAETTSLFNDTYGRDLDSDVVHDLMVRTEGWAASLHLVQAALRDRSTAEIRRFVRNLDGADRDLYDYLAEVVVGDLPEPMQRFLMTTSILQVVTPEWARVASGASPTDVGRSMTAAERLALLSPISGGPRSHMRYHPLVRGFLTSRLTNLEGEPAVADLHRRVAVVAAETDWRVAVYHYHEAGDESAMLETMDAAIPTIMANAQYSLVESLLGDLPTERRPAGSHLVLSRVDLQRGDYEGAARGAQAVLDASTSDPIQRDHALLNLLAVRFNFGYGEQALEMATALRDSTGDENLRSIAEATIAILQATTERDLADMNRKLRAMAKDQRALRSHHFGVSMYNLAANSLIQDRLADAEREVDEALEAFASTSSVVERQAAGVLRLGILLRTGRVSEARDALVALMEDPETPLQNDALLEAADAFGAYVDQSEAQAILERVGDRSVQTIADRRLAAVVSARFLLRQRRNDGAQTALADYPGGMTTVVGLSLMRDLVEAEIELSHSQVEGRRLLEGVAEAAGHAGIHSVRRPAELLHATSFGGETLGRAIKVIGVAGPWHLTYVAESIAGQLDGLDDEARQAVFVAARTHPARWRTALRAALEARQIGDLATAQALEMIGDRTDIPRLRLLARTKGRSREVSTLGKGLARRLADRIYVEDQGRVLIRIGDRELSGASIRRKVLAMLCVLLTKPDMAATRDQILDTLWPDLDPDVAVNSLNQTLYFLRRVFEEAYVEDLSPGYVHHEGDLIWLDQELVSSRATECERLVRSLPARPSPDDVNRLVELYRGRFALDFEYEEWALTFRDSLHASYLEIVERSLIDDLAMGHLDRAINVARRALAVDPRSDQIEVSLLRLYKATSAHAAAAEQYAHYASVVREDLGIEPPSLESL